MPSDELLDTESIKLVGFNSRWGAFKQWQCNEWIAANKWSAIALLECYVPPGRQCNWCEKNRQLGHFHICPYKYCVWREMQAIWAHPMSSLNPTGGCKCNHPPPSFHPFIHTHTHTHTHTHMRNRENDSRFVWFLSLWKEKQMTIKCGGSLSEL